MNFIRQDTSSNSAIHTNLADVVVSDVVGCDRVQRGFLTTELLPFLVTPLFLLVVISSWEALSLSPGGCGCGLFVVQGYLPLLGYALR